MPDNGKGETPVRDQLHRLFAQDGPLARSADGYERRPEQERMAVEVAKALESGGVLLAGYFGKAAQSMGDAYLLPAIAAVVLGGAVTLVLRLGSMILGWQLPVYRPRPPRNR